MRMRITAKSDLIDYPEEVRTRILDEGFSITFTVGDVIIAIASYILTDNTVSLDLREALNVKQWVNLIRYLRRAIYRSQKIINEPMIAWVDNEKNQKFAEALGFVFDSENKDGFKKLVKDG